MTRRIDISSRTVVFITVFLLGLWVIYQILDLILLLFVAVIFMSALSPVVSYLQKLKMPKALGILIVYLAVIGLLITALTISFAPLLEQTSRLIQVLPNSNMGGQSGIHFSQLSEILGDDSPKKIREWLGVDKKLPSELVIELISGIIKK